MNRSAEKGMGWFPDHTDIRDLTGENANVKNLLTKAGINDSTVEPNKSDLMNQDIPLSIDLRPWCSPIEDHGPLGSCTAHVGVAVVEYFERKASGKHIDASRLLLVVQAATTAAGGYIGGPVGAAVGKAAGGYVANRYGLRELEVTQVKFVANRGFMDIVKPLRKNLMTASRCRYQVVE